MIGRWLVAWTTGTAEMSRVLRVARLEGPDAALAQHDVEVAALGDVLRRHQPLLDGRGHAALEQHRPARSSPTACSSPKFAMLRVPTWSMSACSATTGTSRASTTSVTTGSPVARATSARISRPRRRGPGRRTARCAA